jgi:hypothetical protein
VGRIEDKSHRGQVSLAQIRCDEQLWGEGAEEIVRAWLQEHYNPRTMPTLQVAQMPSKGDEFWLIGWRHAGTQWPALLPLIFGQPYADKRIALNEMAIRMGEAIGEFGSGEYGVPTDRKENE